MWWKQTVLMKVLSAPWHIASLTFPSTRTCWLSGTDICWKGIRVGELSYLALGVCFDFPAPWQLQLTICKLVEEDHKVPVMLVALKVSGITAHLQDHVLYTAAAGEHPVRCLRSQIIVTKKVSSVGLLINPLNYLILQYFTLDKNSTVMYCRCLIQEDISEKAQQRAPGSINI